MRKIKRISKSKRAKILRKEQRDIARANRRFTVPNWPFPTNAKPHELPRVKPLV